MITFSQYASQWQATFNPVLKPATVATFSSHISLLNKTFGEKSLADFKADSMVQAGINQLASDHAPKTVANIAGTLLNILRRAHREGLISYMPDPKLPEIREKEQPWYTVPEVQKLVPASPDPLNVLVYLLAETGLRIGEALALADSDLRDGTLMVRKSVWRGEVGSTKCRSSDRKLSISKHLQGILSPIVSNQTPGFVFRTSQGTPKWPTTITSALSRAAEKAGMGWLGFHGLRRLNATLMADLGVPEQVADMRQGHSFARGLTYRLYSQRSGLKDQEWAEKISQVLTK